MKGEGNSEGRREERLKTYGSVEMGRLAKGRLSRSGCKRACGKFTGVLGLSREYSRRY